MSALPIVYGPRVYARLRGLQRVVPFEITDKVSWSRDDGTECLAITVGDPEEIQAIANHLGTDVISVFGRVSTVTTVEGLTVQFRAAVSR